LQERSPNEKFLPEDDEIVSISTKTSHTHRKNLRMLQLLWKMQLQIQYTPVELRPSVYVTEEPAEFYA
jgi:hypothetical protein